MRNSDDMEVNPAKEAVAEKISAPRFAARNIIGRILLHGGFLLLAVVAFVMYEHFKLNAEATPSLVSLAAAGGLVLAPVRAVLHELFVIESRVMHVLHGVGGLALGGLALGGVISGGPLLSHAALAPFSIMGAAQALMHSNHPRNSEQAEALRRFVTSLPEVEQFTKSGDLSSPANVRRAVAVLTDLVAKAQALGETELKSDPGFQSALSRVTTRFGLSLGLDAVDRALGQLAANPAAASAIPELRKQLAAARKTIKDS